MAISEGGGGGEGRGLYIANWENPRIDCRATKPLLITVAGNRMDEPSVQP